MLNKRLISIAAVLVFGVVLSGAASARDQIRIVGSSTVFPFATAVAEEFGKSSGFKTPIVESTGSGGGLKLFCAGLGLEHPDITNASRRIKSSELDKCGKNGVQLTEVKFGFDGIVVANSRKSPRVQLSLRQLFLALGKEVPGPDGKLIANPHKKWSDIDPSLPASKIEVLGPPPTSGTRDAFNELAIEGGCKTFPDLEAIKKQDKKRYKAICRAIREDGAYVEAGENDNLIVQKLLANPKAFGVFGYSFLDQNVGAVQGNVIEGIEPTFENISSGEYAISRSLYFYVKNAHADSVPGIREYMSEFTSEKAVGEYGYLTDKGLIPLPPKDLARYRKSALGLSALTGLDAHE